MTGACLDSRVVRSGDLYVALPGARAHGASFARAAVEALLCSLADAVDALTGGDHGAGALAAGRRISTSAEASAS